MASIYTIGKSALMAANYGISVTGHNISNAYTPGYNRQVILQSNTPGQQFGFGFVGAGTSLDEIRRVYDQFLGKQFMEVQAESSRLDTYYTQILKINNSLADDTAGVSPALQQFFAAVQEVATLPTSVATRESMISDARILVGRYNNLGAQIKDQQDLINAQMIHSVELINTYAVEIAKLNNQIAHAQISLNDPPPNDLLDQRDHLIAQLSQEVGVRTVVNGNSLDIYVGNGQPLVINHIAFEMYTKPSSADPDKIEIGYINNGVYIEIPDRMFSGGNLTGYIDYRNNELNGALNELGLMAITLANDFNIQHMLGQDLEGRRGIQFFDYPTLSAVASEKNSGLFIQAEITTIGDLVASNYHVSYNAPAGGFTITNQADGTKHPPGLGAYYTPAQMIAGVEIDGVTFSLGTPVPPGPLVTDMLTLKPLAGISAGLELLVTDPNRIAAALPIRTDHGLNNLGSGKISLGELVAFGSDGPVQDPSTLVYPLELVFQSDTTPSGLSIVPNEEVTVTYADGTSFSTTAPFAYEEGMTIAYGSFTFNITGVPEPADVFRVVENIEGIGDNRNMLALAALQDAKTMLNGTTTYQGAYSQLVNRVGAKTRELEIMSTSTANLLNQIYRDQQSQSGVNLDEEAVNLMRYQQNYNAASKVIQTANEMFNAILAIF